MNSLDKLILALGGTLLAALIAAVMHSNYEGELTRREAIKAGLVEGFLPGNGEKVWMKPAL
jgi:phosphate starvation-inducible protein PhoH